MFQVTEKASEMIREFLKNQKDPKPIRITSQIGWGGPTLGMALDEPMKEDLEFSDRDVKFIIDKKLFEEVKPINVDFVESADGSGFKLTSNLAAGAGCEGSCCGWRRVTPQAYWKYRRKMNNHAGKRCSANQRQRQFGRHHRTAKHYGGNGVRCPGHPALIPEHYIQALVGGNSLWANFFASIVGALMYFATLTEVRILQGLLGSGMGQGPALAMLLAGPALSLPSMIAIASIIGIKKTAVYCSIVVVLSTIAGMGYGWLVA